MNATIENNFRYLAPNAVPNSTAAGQTKSSQVTEQFELLGSAIDRVVSLSCELEPSLIKVLRPEEDCKAESFVETSIVPYADMLRTLRYRVEVVEKRIQSILQRLEL